MEENESKSAEVPDTADTVQPEAADGSAQLTREQILATSREENKNGDERERQFYIKATSYASSIGLLLAGIIIFVSSLVEKRLPIEVLLIMTAMQSTQAFIASRGGRKIGKIYLIIAICEAVVAVALLVLWILMLCGVSL